MFEIVEKNLLKNIRLLPLFFISACATTVVDVPTQKPVVVEDRAVVNGRVLPLPNEPKIEVETLSKQPEMSAVARKLLIASETQSRAGDLDSAANSLERALRLETRNALLWSRLAGIRYQQENWQQAVQLAAKSNTLSAQNKSLRRQNWNMIANSYDAMGDEESAKKYREMLSN